KLQFLLTSPAVYFSLEIKLVLQKWSLCIHLFILGIILIEGELLLSKAFFSTSNFEISPRCILVNYDTRRNFCFSATHCSTPRAVDTPIGYRHVVDATLQEEACSLASLLIAVTSKGALTCMKKIGKGSLDPESIFEMMERSRTNFSMANVEVRNAEAGAKFESSWSQVEITG
uniref:Exoribonuclease phosphorolytic domain-containing protein n=1 Tax=Anas zonorhyncha TaxID=75864 RepID=A0A8B9VL00_9AVES